MNICVLRNRTFYLKNRQNETGSMERFGQFLVALGIPGWSRLRRSRRDHYGIYCAGELYYLLNL